jgi:DNA-binding ferritin-like protein
MDYYSKINDDVNNKRNILYRQIDTVSSMNKLLSTLVCERTNLMNYLINVKNRNSNSISVYLNDLIDKFDSYISFLYEQIKIKKGFPIFELTDIENISQIKTVASIDYKETTINMNIYEEFKTIVNLINEVINCAIGEQDYYCINTLSQIKNDINKIIIKYEL